MAYTETTTQSYGSRLKNSLKGIIFGLLLFVGGTILLFWNEGRSVHTSATIKDARENVVDVEDVSEIDPNLNGKLIHASAFADTKDVLTDSTFNISTTAIKLIRKVSYYQWKEKSHQETKEKFGGGTETVTTYDYEKRWVDEPINSDNFHDPEYKGKNFVLTELNEQTILAQNVSFGAYHLPKFLINKMSNEEALKVSLTDEQLKEWQNNHDFGGKHCTKIVKKPLEEATPTSTITPEVTASPEVTANEEQPTPTATPVKEVEQVVETPIVHLLGDTIYIGCSPDSAEIGDVKISFSQVLPADVSIIAKVNNSSFEEYKTKTGSFSRLNTGTVSADNMFAEAESENSFLTWLLRAVGLFLLFIGLTMIFDIVSMLLKWFPALGHIAEAGVGIVCFVGALIWGLLVIAIAWFFYRPIAACVLIVLAVAGIIFLKRKGDKKAQE